MSKKGIIILVSAIVVFFGGLVFTVTTVFRSFVGFGMMHPSQLVEETHIYNTTDSDFGLGGLFFNDDIDKDVFNDITTEMKLGDLEEHKDKLIKGDSGFMSGFFVNEISTNKLQWYNVVSTDSKNIKDNIVKKAYYDVNATFTSEIATDLVANHNFDIKELHEGRTDYGYYYNFISDNAMYYLVGVRGDKAYKHYVYSSVDGKEYSANYPKLITFFNENQKWFA